LSGWSEGWLALRGAIGLAPPSWLSASLTAFVCAGLAAMALSAAERRIRR
jgi:hypothetical protein